MLDFKIRQPLLEHDVDELLEALKAQRPGVLTFIAEKFGHFMTELLEHPEAIVREGAVLGLADVPVKIVSMAHMDPSPAVKKTAYDIAGVKRRAGESSE